MNFLQRLMRQHVDRAAALLQSDNSALSKLLLIHMYHSLTEINHLQKVLLSTTHLLKL